MGKSVRNYIAFAQPVADNPEHQDARERESRRLVYLRHSRFVATRRDACSPAPSRTVISSMMGHRLGPLRACRLFKIDHIVRHQHPAPIRIVGERETLRCRS
jgi:hypothetical protein